MLEHTRKGGMDTYNIKFEEYCYLLEESDKGISKEQKNTFFIKGIKHRDYYNTKEICENKNLHETSLMLRKKELALNEAST